jgi:dTDP-glucose 4,6-dehydratase
VLVTSGAGFIGGHFILGSLAEEKLNIINLDALTYAGNLDTLSTVEGSDGYHFVEGSIGDRTLVASLLTEHPEAVINFAAESHVDRSIDTPDDFVQTNVVGTFELLEAVRSYWSDLPVVEQKSFRFLHISTDEVYGSLGEMGLFTEMTPCQPNSPYSASKAALDHLVRAYFQTYGLPVLITNGSNNYGSYRAGRSCQAKS